MEGDRVTRKIIVFTYVGRTWNFDVELYIFINIDSRCVIPRITTIELMQTLLQ